MQVSREVRFTNYKDSPVSHLLVHLLKHIGEIKKKYANFPASEAKQNAYELVNLAEEVLTTLHKHIFPVFDHGKAKLGLRDLGGIAFHGLKYKSIGDKFKTREWALWASVEKMLKALRKSERSLAGNRQVAINAYLDAHRHELFKEAKKVLSGNNLDETLQYIQAVISDYHLFADMADDKIFADNCNMIFSKMFAYGAPYGIHSVKADHAMTYELVVEVAIQLLTIPQQVKDLVPFINPEVASIDLSKGPLGAIAGLFTNKTVELANVPSNNPHDPLSYNYRLTMRTTTEKGIKEKVDEYDGANYYEEYIQWAMSALLREVRELPAKCNTKCPNDDEVQEQYKRFMLAAVAHYQNGGERIEGERARSKFFLGFLELKNSEYTERARQQAANAKTNAELDNLDGWEAITALREQISYEVEREKYAAKLSEFSYEIEFCLFKHFVQNNEAANELLNGITPKYLAFMRAPCPHDVIVEAPDGNLIIEPIKSRYIDMTNQAMQQLAYHPQRKIELEAKLKAKLATWKTDVAAHLQKIQQQIIDVELPRLTERLEAAAVQANVDVKTITDINAVDASIQLEKEHASLEALRKDAQTLLVRARAETEQVIQAAQMHQEPEMNAAAALVVSAVNKGVNDLIHHLNQVAKQLDEKLRHLTTMIANAKEAKAFEETMRDQGVAQLQVLLENAAAEGDKLQARRKVTKQKLQQHIAELTNKELVLTEALEKTYQEMYRRLDELEKEMKAMMSITPEDIQGDSAQFLKFLDLKNREKEAQIKEMREILKSGVGSAIFWKMEVLVAVLNILQLNIHPKEMLKQIDALEWMHKRNGNNKNYWYLLGILNYQDKAWEKSIKDVEKLHRDILTEMAVTKTSIAAMEKKAGISDVESDVKQLQKYKHDFSAKIALIQQHRSSKQGIDKDYRLALQKLDPIRQLIDADRSEFQEIINQHKSMLDRRLVIETRIAVLNEVDEFRRNIEEFEHATGNFVSDTPLQERMFDLTKSQASFDEMIAATRNKLKDATASQPLLKATEDLLNSTRERIKRALEKKFSHEITQVDELIQDVEDYCSRTNSVAVQPEPYKEAAELQYRGASIQARFNELLAKVQNGEICNEVIRPQVTKLNQAMQTLQEMLKERVQFTLDAQRPNVAKLTQQCADIDKNYSQLVMNQEAKVLFDKKTAVAITELLQQIHEPFIVAQQIQADQVSISQNILLLRDFSLLGVFPSPLKEVLAQQYRLQRTQLLIGYPARFTEYLNLRALRFRRKDKYSSTDKIAREEYINQFNELIATQSLNANDNKDVLAKLGQGIYKFPGTHFHALLYKMMVELKDLERDFDMTQGALLGQEKSSSALHNEAILKLQLFSDHQQQQRSFKRNIEYLYQDIAALREEADVVRVKYPDSDDGDKLLELAEHLQADVDRYVLNKDVLTQAKAQGCYAAFREIFNERLHSCDNLIAKHRPLWPIIINIAAGILTLGLAVAACALVTKLYYGSASLFFGRYSAMNSKVADLGETVNEDMIRILPQASRGS